jgi:2-octaprenyl-6-methoxyphenol hydroxylase
MGQRVDNGTSGRTLVRDYGQTAWVGTVSLDGAQPGTAFERFTRHGPVALLLLDTAGTQAALVWCVAGDDDPVAGLTDAQRRAVLGTLLPRQAGRITGISTLQRFALGLKAQATLVHGRVVRIGNAAQTLHPVAGQGLNLGLRDAQSLVQSLIHLPSPGTVEAALRRVEWARASDRWTTMAATDFLARSFTWRAPGMAAARGGALKLLDLIGPAKTALARRMMFGQR